MTGYPLQSRTISTVLLVFLPSAGIVFRRILFTVLLAAAGRSSNVFLLTLPFLILPDHSLTTFWSCGSRPACFQGRAVAPVVSSVNSSFLSLKFPG